MVECNDTKCPIHGNISVRGIKLDGIVVQARADRMISIERENIQYLAKYERYKKTKTKIKAHAPKCMNIGLGDKVVIGEARKISKTKNFVVLEVLSKEE